MTVFKLLLKIVVAPVIVLLTLFVWTCVALVYVSGLVLGLASMVIALLGVAVLVTYSPQNGLILLLIAFLISPYGLPKLAFWMLSKVQGLKYTTINEQISNFAQSYPANSITASIEAPLLINRYRFVSCSCFSCFCKKA